MFATSRGVSKHQNLLSGLNVIYLMNVARCTYYKEFIDENSSDLSKLFRASKSLLNLQADKSLPPHSDASVLANEMGEFFIHKIVAIRSKLAGDTVFPAGRLSVYRVAVMLPRYQSLSLSPKSL